jgi:hypothetical protein
MVRIRGYGSGSKRRGSGHSTKPANLLPHVMAGVGAAALVCEYGLEAVVTAGVGASVPGEPPLLHITLSQVLQPNGLKPGSIFIKYGSGFRPRFLMKKNLTIFC